MKHAQSLCYSVWEIPKYRRKVLYGPIRLYLGEVVRELARQQKSQVLEGHLCSDHVHVYISIPVKYAVAQVVGYIKGKSAIHIARSFSRRVRNFTGKNFWARGYFASTVGRDVKAIRDYIRRKLRNPSPHKGRMCQVITISVQVGNTY